MDAHVYRTNAQDTFVFVGTTFLIYINKISHSFSGVERKQISLSKCNEVI